MAHDTYNIYQSYAEVITENLIPPVIAQTYIEVVSSNQVTSDIAQTYIEVVSSSSPKPQVFDQEGNALLVEFSVNGTIHRISNQDIPLTHFWQNYVIGFDTISYNIDNLHGGYVRLNFGGISLNPEMFSGEGDWEPPVSCPVTVYITTDKEENKTEIFSGTAHLERFGKDQLDYQFYGENNDVMLLEEDYPYDDQSLDIVNATHLKWTLSATGTATYYCEITAGGDPSILEPARVMENFSEMEKGTATSLSAGEWDYGDYDELGYNTVYVRLSDDTDPDTKDVGYLRADYIEEKVPIPKAFGKVTHVSPLRLPDRAGYPTYHLGGITGDLTDEIAIDSFAYAGSYTIVYCTHSFVTGDKINIIETDYYNGEYSIIVFIAGSFFIQKAYKPETAGQGKIVTDISGWNVYDDGVSVASNVTDNGDGTFSLDAEPVGKVTISGTGQDTNLSDIIEWACGVPRLNKTYDSDMARDPSPDVHFWADKQQVLVDFLSEIAAWNTHLFYFYADNLFLVDIGADNDSRAISEFDYFESDYRVNPPISFVSAEWQTRYSGEQGGVKVLLEESHNISVSGNYVYGNEKKFTPYDSEESVVRTKLQSILNILNQKQVTLKIPFDGVMPKPGERFYGTEESTVRNTAINFRVRSIQYDFNSDTVNIEGDEVI